MSLALSQYKEKPFFKTRDLSKALVPVAVSQLNNFMKNDKDSGRRPEEDALTFYLLNHAFSLLQLKFEQDEPLNEASLVANEYMSEEIGEATLRAFYYLLLICTRESRHVHKSADFHNKLESKYGKTIKDWNLSISGTGSGATAQRFKDYPPNVPLGQYTESLVFTFYKGGFGGGFGGKAWGKVADCLNDFVWGRTTAEMMMDTVWTLSHNNGPIFNKGMLYTGYTSELKKILDVQRSGQIPNLIFDYKKGIEYISLVATKHIELYDRLIGVLPELATFTDWGIVEALGSLQKYPMDKKTQNQHYGETEEMKLLKKAAEAKALEQTKWAEELQKQKQEEDAKKWWFISPTQKVAIVIRNKAK